MKIKKLWLLSFFLHLNLMSTDVNNASTNDKEDFLNRITWGTTTSGQTLHMMAFTGLPKLVARGKLMDDYGLPIVGGSSAVLGAFDLRNDHGISGNLVNSLGGIFDLLTITSLLTDSVKREDFIKRLTNQLEAIEKQDPILDRDVKRAKVLLRQLHKISPSFSLDEFSKLKEHISHDEIDVPLGHGIRWDAEEFYSETPANFPIIFVSTTIFADLKAAEGSGCPYEYLAIGEVTLGQKNDIQYVVVAEVNKEHTTQLLGKIFAASNDKPTLLTFEELEAPLKMRISNIKSRTNGLWPTYTKSELESFKDLPRYADVLPAFGNINMPFAITCTTSQLNELLGEIRKLGLKPVAIHSPLVPQFSSLTLKSPQHIHALDEEIDSFIQRWREDIEIYSSKIELLGGRILIPEQLVVHVEAEIVL